MKEALSTDFKGPKVVIAQSECMLNKQRRVKPQVAAAVGRGERVVKEKFGVDAAVCSGDHACMRLSGCPSLTLKATGDPLKPESGGACRRRLRRLRPLRPKSPTPRCCAVVLPHRMGAQRRPRRARAASLARARRRLVAGRASGALCSGAALYPEGA